ncbi:MAG: glycosyltransferase [Deltaproteobacteria bacterium]|nr:glycosyltransferase [Deltaproteobacteria bacterium]
MKASVIIPTYNRPDLLRRQLACLAEQQGERLLEVLVCDDGSATDTQAVIAPFQGRIPGLRLFWQEDLGFRAGQARNMGIRAAQGDLLIFVDDDVLLPAHFVQFHAAAHARAGNGAPERQIVLGFRYRTRVPPRGTLPTDAEIDASEPDCRVHEIGFHGEQLASHPQPWFYVYSCNFSIPGRYRVLFDENFVGWGMEDTELGYRLVRAGYAVRVEPMARVLHVEAKLPRDPFICENRGLPPVYDTYVNNMVYFLTIHPHDRGLHELLAGDLRWYVRDESGQHWIKDGHEHDPSEVIDTVRRAWSRDSQRAAIGQTAPRNPAA